MRTFPHDGLALAFHEAGSGVGLPVVLIHGWGCDHSFLAPQQTFLAAARRTVAIDLRGHGASGGSPGRDAVGVVADDVAALCRVLELRRPVLLGHSMGGNVALACAARHPGLVGAAVAIDSALFPPAPMLEHARALVGALRGPDDPALLPHVASLLCQGDGDPAVEAAFLGALRATPRHVLADALEAHTAGFDAADVLARCRCPVAYLGADAPLADMDRLRETCPGIRTERLAGAGHFAPLSMPRQVNALLARLITATTQESQP